MNLHKYAQRLLSYMAKRVMIKYNPKIIAITGSIGKTSAKEAISGVVSGSFTFFSTPKNYNNEYGVPLTILGLNEPPGRSIKSWIGLFWRFSYLIFFRDKDFPQVLILEMGADNPGDIANFMKFITPNIGVLTNIGPSHLEKFGTIDKIIKEKKRIITSALKNNGTGILNADNEYIFEFFDDLSGSVISFGFSEKADVRALLPDVDVNENGIFFKILYKGNAVPVHLSGCIGRPVIYACLSAVATGLALGVTLLDCVERLNAIKWPYGRMTLRRAVNGALIIDDTYNASEESTKSALDGLISCKKNNNRLIVVLGSMFELGDYEQKAHQSVGEHVAKCGIDFLICVGNGGRLIGKSAEKYGMDIHSIMYVGNSNQAGVALLDLIVEGDAVLIKGSRGMMMERAVAMMVEEV